MLALKIRNTVMMFFWKGDIIKIQTLQSFLITAKIIFLLHYSQPILPVRFPPWEAAFLCKVAIDNRFSWRSLRSSFLPQARSAA